MCLSPVGHRWQIWRMRITCWLTKATNTHSEYVILIAFPLQQCLHERAIVACYVHVLPCPFYVWCFNTFGKINYEVVQQLRLAVCRSHLNILSFSSGGVGGGSSWTSILLGPPSDATVNSLWPGTPILELERPRPLPGQSNCWASGKRSGWVCWQNFRGLKRSAGCWHVTC